MPNWIKITGMLLAGAILTAACSTTQLTSVWKDPEYHSRPEKILVIGLARRPDIRKMFEDEFVNQIRTHGTDAIASYTVLPDLQKNDQAAIAAKVKELGADFVLITRLVNKKTVQVYVPGTAYVPPPYYGTWTGYYGYGYSSMYAPGYVTKNEYAVVETNLYAASNDKLVWTALSETIMDDTNKNLIASYIDVMVKAMSYNKLLGK